MKILSIRLKNLASIEGYFDIDFTCEPLSSAGIFAISGPTGAGKSTILDALCLALYDKTPRFAATNESLYLKDVGENEINQSDVKNILRRGVGEGFAEVVFVGVDGHRYQSRWSVRRARGKSTGSLQAQTMQVVDLDTDKELQGTKTEILNQQVVLTGLTYEQFTRTVLLAQNDFATFLKSRESAKAELLEKLTGTEIYSQISRSVYAHSKRALEELNRLKSSQNLIELLPEEELKQLQEDKRVWSEQRTVAVQQLNLLNDKLKVVTSLRTQREILSRKQVEASAEVEQWKRLQAEYTKQAEKFDVFKKQCEALQPELRKARELDTRIQGFQAQFTQAEQLYSSVRSKKEEVDRLLVEKEHALTADLQKLTVGEQGDEDFAEGSAEEKLHQINENFNVIREKPHETGEKLYSKDEKLHQAEEKLTRAEGDLKQYEQLLAEQQQANDERVVQLNAYSIQSLGEEQRKLLQEQKHLQTGRQLVLDWMKLCKEVELLTQEIKERQALYERSEKDFAAHREQLNGKQQQLQTLQRVYDHARMAMSKDVESLRQHLTPGEACPVCGATEHPYTHAEGAADTIFRQVEKEYKAAAEDVQALNNRTIIAGQQLHHLQEEQKQSLVRLENLQKEVSRQTPEKGEERVPEYYDLRMQQLQQLLDELSGKLKAYQQLYDEWQQHDAAIKKLRLRWETFREAIASCRLLLQQVASIKEQVAAAAAHEKEEEARFVKVREELHTLTTERSALLKGKTADDAEAAVQRHEKELGRQLEECRQAVEKQSARLSGLQGEIRQLSVVVDELTKEYEQIGEPEKLPEAIRDQQAVTQEIERNLSMVEARLLQQEQNRKRLEGIAEELKSKQATAEQWEKLNKLIGSADGTKFKVIAQSYTLNLLLMHANKHLSYLSKRYRLQQVPDTLALQVIDCDMCDEIRTVYSLSGGESFLISLALALGLSSLSSNNLKVESLFIDEGFGSLDAESLRTAMEALEQLQMQGRKIGVISHVQEMSERIPVQIQVHKLVNGKSEILLHS